MKSKRFLFLGIILLSMGIVLKKLTQMNTLGLALIIMGVTFKTIYIISKVKSGEYKPGNELIYLIVGLILFFIGLSLRNVNQTFIKPIYLIVLGITFKIVFVIRFIQICCSIKTRVNN